MEEVLNAVADRRKLATKFGISRAEQELNSIAFKTTKD